jgi:release factor glutamine methyltransferase
MSKLLGKKVLEEVRERDRVLDLGTGCGTNAILAASRSSNVVGVDVNQFAIDAAIKNAKRNGVGDRIKFLVGDLFSAVDGRFDLIIFDPPFRWFKPRDIRERAVADGNFETLTKFFFRG